LASRPRSVRCTRYRPCFRPALRNRAVSAAPYPAQRAVTAAPDRQVSVDVLALADDDPCATVVSSAHQWTLVHAVFAPTPPPAPY
jgi:hypothetical protein